MSKPSGRIENVRTSMTPNQAVTLWMLEAHHSGSMFAYSETLGSGNGAGQLLDGFNRRIKSATEKRLRGRQAGETNAAILSAQKDVAFPFMLHIRVNVRVGYQLRAWQLSVS